MRTAPFPLADFHTPMPNAVISTVSDAVATQVATAITRWEEHVLYRYDRDATSRANRSGCQHLRGRYGFGVENPSLIEEYFVMAGARRHSCAPQQHIRRDIVR
jgi:hypothetical protein